MMIVKKELISIIAPCYNVEKTLSRYLNSILGQTYKNIEVIAIMMVPAIIQKKY